MYKKKCYLCKWAYSIYLLLQMADALSLDSATVEDFILGDDKVRWLLTILSFNGKKCEGLRYQWLGGMVTEH